MKFIFSAVDVLVDGTERWGCVVFVVDRLVCLIVAQHTITFHLTIVTRCTKAY